MSLIRKSHNCPYRQTPHSNMAFAEYANGHWCYGCNKGVLEQRDYQVSLIAPAIDAYVGDLSDYTFNPKHFSMSTLSWLYRYYIYDDNIRRYNIGYKVEDNTEYLLFPTIKENKIVAFQTRSFPEKEFYSKYTNKHIFNTKDITEQVTEQVVLVEDFISAIRIGEYTNSIWLQGTSIREDIITHIIKNYSHICIWLDPDDAGRDNSKKIYKKLKFHIERDMRLHAFATKQQKILAEIHSELDPKCYSPSQLTEFLQ